MSGWVDYLSTSDDKVIKSARAFEGMDILDKEGEVEKGHVKHMINGERQRLIKKVESANSLEKMSKVLEELVKERIVTQEWAAGLEYCMKNEPKKGEVPEHDIWVSPGLIGGGLGIENIKLPGFSEGNATYVANALYKFIKQVTTSPESLKELVAQPIRSIYYASESNSDRSKPELETALQMVYSVLLMEKDGKARYGDIIDMFNYARPVPITYACAGGGIALMDAVNEVNASVLNNRLCSALVITADTAIYDSRKAPRADCTQGAAATLMLIKSDPQLAIVLDKMGSFHSSFHDFTKYIDETPIVHGKFSEIIYVYMVAKAVEALEKSFNGEDLLKNTNYFITHVPFPKQAKYFAGSLYVHYLRMKHPALLKRMEKEIGDEPLAGYKNFTGMIDDKLSKFNNDPNVGLRKEREIIEHIEGDKDIKAYWNWLKKVREQPEFKDFLARFKIEEVLGMSANVGNSYTGSVHVAYAGLMANALENASIDTPKRLVLCYYGSGAVAQANVLDMIATAEVVKDRLSVRLDTKNNQLDVEQYLTLHRYHLMGESARFREIRNAHEKDMKEMLRSDVMPEGFYIVSRNADGAGKYIYSDGKDLKYIPIRH